MKTLKIAMAATAALFLTHATAFAQPAKPAKPMVGHELQAQAKVDLATARATALKARPGKVTDEELEKEKGGSGLRYSFDIKVKGATYEVGVDAQTGAVLENAKEGKNPD
jgi:uncharacterized membrane protein YkoI